MTEYNVTSPPYLSTHSFNRIQAESPYSADKRHNPFVGTCRAVRSSIELFEAELDDEHEVSILLASFGSSVEFRAEEIRFSPSNVITFHGYTDAGEKVHFVQHVSQISLLLKAARKMNETPLRVVFNHAAA
ncbi:MAG TPA: DUF6173 family protein [Geobacteraceae bacterium]|nr:DUF6173 family protein [Geobacteraceae bacterium]